MRMTVAAAVACLCFAGLTAGSDAQAIMQRYELNIPKQSLDAALQDFAQQTGLQIARFTDAIDGNAIVGPISGMQSVEEALKALLAPSGLSFKVVGDRTIAVVNPKDATASSGDARDEANQYGTQAAASTDTAVRMARAFASSASPSETNSGQGNTTTSDTSSVSDDTAEVVVRGVRFYQPNVGRSASKMDLPLLETPLSVSIVTSDQMEARAADSLEQAFRYSAGVFSVGGGSNRRGTTGFVMRGFNTANEGNASLYVNGSRYPINGNSGGVEPYLYESVELLKGPASVLYGQASPGGLINMVSKFPTRQPLRSIKLQAGSWDNRQVNADFGGPLTEDGTWGYRLTGVARDSGSMIDHIPDDRTVLASTIRWSPSDQTALSLLATYNATKTVYDVGKPFEGTVLPNPNGKIPRKLFMGEPGFDKFEPTGRTLGYLFEHRFSDTWQVRQNALWFDHDVEFASTGVFNRVDAGDPRLANRYVYTRHDIDKGWSVDNQLLGKWATSRFEHTALLGADYSEHDFSRTQPFTLIGTWDMFNPVYGAAFTLPAPGRAISNSTQLGIYLQDHIKLDQRWVAMLGGRWDRAKRDDRSISAAGAVDPSGATDSKLTKRVGLLYLSDVGLAPYLSYSESFQPVEGTDFSGRSYDPTAGVQYEAGIKWEPKNQSASLTFAAYQLTRENVLTPDLVHPGFAAQTGEVRSRGVELEGRVSLGEKLDLLASYGSTDAEVTKSNGADLGQTPVSVPKSTASLWVDYHYNVRGRGEMSFGAGARYVGESFAAGEIATVPSYTDFDLSMRYVLAKWRFSLNVKNLLDKEYVSSCAYSCFYGEQRNVTVSAQYSW